MSEITPNLRHSVLTKHMSAGEWDPPINTYLFEMFQTITENHHSTCSSRMVSSEASGGIPNVYLVPPNCSNSEITYHLYENL